MRVPRGSPVRLAASLGRDCVTSRPRIDIRTSYSALQTCQRGFATSGDLSGLKDVLHISEEVADAIATNQPVVALESTIYTHGAFEEDLELEEIVRKNGAIPAVCGVYNGVATVGLEKHEIREMVESKASKISRRDFAGILGDRFRGKKRHGGTTIAGTMILARLAGIRVFGTGGLGGVHRGGESSLDISADLTELGRTRVAVVSSGCKGFLDIPRTLEYLETQGVVVATFNEPGTDFPAFWARESGVKSPGFVEGARDAAGMIYAQEKLGIESGLLFANPIPKNAAIPRDEMEAAIDRAVQDAEREGCTGANNTPFILQKIREYTEGRSVEANLALVRSNVSVAAHVAHWLSIIDKYGPFGFDPNDEAVRPPFIYTRSGLLQQSSVPAKSKTNSMNSSPVTPKARVDPEVRRSSHPERTQPTTVSQGQQDSLLESGPESDQRVDIVVAGSVALDLSCDYLGAQGESPKMHTSNPANITQSVGGVGHNVALAAHLFGGGDVKVKLCSVVGNDVAGASLLDAIRAEGLSTSHLRELGNPARTAQYVSVNDSQKSLVLAMADMDINQFQSPPKEYWVDVLDESKPRCVVVDANWGSSTIRSILSAAGRSAWRIFEPVSVAKSVRLFQLEPRLGVFPQHDLSLTTPNIYELSAMYDAAKERGYFHDNSEWTAMIENFNIRGVVDRDYEAHFDKLMGSTSPEIRAAGIPQKLLHLLPYIPSILVKFGEHGCLLAQIVRHDDKRLTTPTEDRYILSRALPDKRIGGVYMRYWPAIEVPPEHIVSVNGVGDTFLGVLTAGLARNGRLDKLAHVAQVAATMTLQSKEAVSPELRGLSRAREREAPRN